ncbi:MAG: DMT family transporter [Steroidobacteraceae bacterium]|jgi:drug/metabolite transporter (DMT)-like permease|nr:DMT family transporter [Gammaproteobacteria bacterium]
MHTAERRALAQMHFCVLLWGFTAILGKLISLPAAALVVWRMVLVTGMLAAIPAVWRGLRAMSVRGIAIYAGIGVVLALHWLTFYGAIKLANASVAVSCVALGSIFTAILEPWLTRRAHERHEFLLGLIAVPGVVLVAGGIPAGMQLGLAVGILSAFLTALLSTLNKRHIGDGSALALTFVQIGAGAIFVALGMYLLQGSESLTTLPAGEDLLWLLLLAVVCTLLPYVLWLRALRHISAFATQLALNLEPVYAILIAALWFREDRELTVSFYVGVLIILSAVALQPLLRRIDRR